MLINLSEALIGQAEQIFPCTLRVCICSLLARSVDYLLQNLTSQNIYWEIGDQFCITTGSTSGLC